MPPWSKSSKKTASGGLDLCFDHFDDREREYVTKNQGRFSPTMLGERVSTLLVKSFEDIFDVTFTARLEEELDEIEEGKLPWREAVKEFWEKFVVDLDKAGDEMLSYKAGIPTGKKCENAARANFWSESAAMASSSAARDIPTAISFRISPPNFPKKPAANPKPNIVTIAVRKWPSSAAASARSSLARVTRIARPPAVWFRARASRTSPMSPWTKSARFATNGLVKKHGRFGEFIGCSGYPKCKYTRPITMGIKCPKCNEGEFVRRGSAGKGGRGRPRVFYGCSRYPDCDFTSPHMPIAEPCPKCGAPFIVEKRTKIGTVHAVSRKVATGKKLAPEAPTQAPSEEVPVPVAAKS